MADNIPNLGREIVVRFFETQRIPNRLNPKRATLRHIIVNTQYLLGFTTAESNNKILITSILLLILSKYSIKSIF